MGEREGERDIERERERKCEKEREAERVREREREKRERERQGGVVVHTVPQLHEILEQLPYDVLTLGPKGERGRSGVVG
jgi:hypothetical protein